MTITSKPVMALKDHGAETRLELMEETKYRPYPKAVFFIVVTEFCERFSYYGMRAVLTIYMRNILNFSEDLSTTIYHVFLMLCYGLPIFGGIIADNFLGKYKTIVFSSIIFTLGNFVLTLSSVTPLNLPVVPLCLVGLVLMGIGTSGIKPCVCPLGAEQFHIPGQEKEQKQFFSLFVFAVSIGSMVSTVITPVLRRDVECFGQDTCYPLAFGIPSILMIVAIIVFTLGKMQYTIKNLKENIIVKVTRCISFAISQKFKNRSTIQEKKQHWLDYAGSKYDASLIKDTKGFLRVLVYYLPVPMFFALYEQLGSRWTLQATRMNGEVGNFMIKPDQMQVANAVLMFIFIPIFETVVYPIFLKCNLLKRPLQRMGVGGILAALSFLLAGIVETSIENSTGHFSASDAHLNFINTIPCPVTIYNVESNSTTFLENRILVPAQANLIVHFPMDFPNFPLNIVAHVENSCGNFTGNGNAHVSLVQGKLKTVLISNKDSTLVVDSFLLPEDIKKSKEGNAKIRFILAEKFSTSPPFLINLKNNNDANIFFNLSSAFTNDFDHENGNRKAEYNEGLSFSKTIEIKPNSYEISLKTSETSIENLNILNSRTDLLTGGSYLVVIYPSLKLETIIITPPNSVHMLWLLPQYVLMAWAEVLYIISGIEFSFTEAPASMKSVLQSCWHLANAVGNGIVIISAQLNLEQKYEFFGFSTLMALDVILFCLLAMKYQYVSPDPGESKNSSQSLNDYDTATATPNNAEKVEETLC